LSEQTIEWTDETMEELRPRRRLRLLTPVTGTLLAVLVAACAFAAGVLVEKGQAGSGGTTAAPAAAFARRAGAGGGAGAGGFFGPGAGPGGGGATVGQVSSLHGRTLDVTDTQGNTIQVKVPAGVTVTRAAPSSVHAIHPGDTVIVQGSRRSNGTISATSVRTTPATTGGGGGGGGGGSALNQLFGGGGPGG